MSYKVFTIAPFDRQLKHLAKKYPSLKKEFANLLESLADKPMQGTALGNGCYKIRLAIASKGKGKSGGARIVTCVQVVQASVYLLSIYDKSDQEKIDDKSLSNLLLYIPK